jgi:hypothetical protein
MAPARQMWEWGCQKKVAASASLRGHAARAWSPAIPMTTAAAEPAVLTSPAMPAALRDFSDRLSPMLVKELRQGLKSHVFTWGLIAMQLALALMALVAMGEGENSEELNAAFWWPVAGIVCILLPMRVANALRDEMGGNTLDTLVLTRLSAWRIALGKWLATGALQVLVATTALPYLIMRYFAGGINLPLELAWLGVYVLFGLLVTAVMLGLSWFRWFLVRAAIMLGVLAAATAFCAATIDEISRTNNYGLDDIYRHMGWAGMACLLLLAVWLGFFFLDIGAAQIAPLSENRATRRRLVALLTLVAGGGAALLIDLPDREARAVLATLLTLAMAGPCIQALCERPVNFAPVLNPFVRRGWWGRLAGLLLYPGWHTGLFFTLLLLAAGTLVFVCLALSVTRWPAMGIEWLVIVAVCAGGVVGGMIAPLVLWRLFRSMEHWNFWRWLLVLLCTGLFHLSVTLIAAKWSWRIAFANHLLPSSGLLAPVVADLQAREEWLRQPKLHGNAFGWDFRWDRERELRITHAAVSLVSLGVWLGIAVGLALRELRNTCRAENELIAENEAKSGAAHPSG